ncbi:alpha-1,2-mannosyltransferase ALG9 [Diaphorina citri]|uniref:Mannosyltransferase n=1 Tax=Diaphorina citri TaxID=121845 RepID=A0A3Q0IYZ5_DIACI|nr:alpha-1,2-mannosyltransferase ALG9 [Diaphorina citri]
MHSTTKASCNLILSCCFRDGDKPVVVNPGDVGLSYPSTMFAFKFLISARFCAAVYSHITDCDETFNFWEPIRHIMREPLPLFGATGFQDLGVRMSFFFHRGVCREFGVHIGRLVLLFQLFSTGMFIASCAYLPSSFSMYMTLLSIGAWFQRKYELAVFTTALSAFLSWPFAALIGYSPFHRYNRMGALIEFLITSYQNKNPIDKQNSRKPELLFMFPIYPLLSLHGAISVDAVQKIYYKILSLCHIVSTRVHYLRYTTPVWVLCVLITSVLCMSRSLLLYKGYGSPVMNTYFELSQLDASFSNMTRSEGQIRLCLGKEWYRYPSSFFLPNDKWNVSFIKSEFRGQLPTYFQPHLNGTFRIYLYLLLPINRS